MPKKVPHLQTRKGRGYFARVVVPPSLRKVIGKRELTESLGIDREIAIQMLPGVLADMKAQLRAARASATTATIHRLVPRANKVLSNRQMTMAHYASELELDRTQRFANISDAEIWGIQRSLIAASQDSDRPKRLADSGDYDSPVTHHHICNTDPYRAALVRVASGKAAPAEAAAVVGWAIDAFCARGNTTIQPGTIEWRKLAADLASIQLEVLKRVEERDAGLFNDKSDHPLLSTTPEAKPGDPLAVRIISPDSAKTLRALHTAFLAERKASASNNYEHQVTLRMFEEAMGNDLPAYKITRQHVHAFKKLLGEAPANYSKRFPALSLPQAVKANNDRKIPFPTLSGKTINDKYLSKLHTFFAWCVSNDIMPDNPASGIKIDVIDDEARREPFRPQDLTRIFSKDHFAPKGQLGEFEWGMIISLFGGHRASELAQIRLDSVRHERGILCFAIEEVTKNKGSKRLIPVHSKLIELGIEKQVALLRKDGKTHLFPEWYRKGMEAKAKASNGTAAATLNHYFPRFLPKVFNNSYLPIVGINDRRKSWHSFRHTFKTGLARAGVVKGIRDDLCGHKDYSAGAAYVHETSVEAMRDAIEKLHFDGLDLSHLT